eukprot:scaffold12221_cov913-Chaetoceros_neogracile.AAC.1
MMFLAHAAGARQGDHSLYVQLRTTRNLREWAFTSTHVAPTLSTYNMNNSSSKKYDDTCGATAITQSSSEDSGPSRMLVRKPRFSKKRSRHYVSKATSKKTHDAPMQKKD